MIWPDSHGIILPDSAFDVLPDTLADTTEDSSWQRAGPVGTAIALHPAFVAVILVLGAIAAVCAIRQALRREP